MDADVELQSQRCELAGEGGPSSHQQSNAPHSRAVTDCQNDRPRIEPAREPQLAAQPHITDEHKAWFPSCTLNAPHTHTMVRQVLVAVDGSDQSNASLLWTAKNVWKPDVQIDCVTGGWVVAACATEPRIACIAGRITCPSPSDTSSGVFRCPVDLLPLPPSRCLLLFCSPVLPPVSMSVYPVAPVATAAAVAAVTHQWEAQVCWGGGGGPRSRCGDACRRAQRRVREGATHSPALLPATCRHTPANTHASAEAAGRAPRHRGAPGGCAGGNRGRGESRCMHTHAPGCAGTRSVRCRWRR
jgi:hypothetical protein